MNAQASSCLMALRGFGSAESGEGSVYRFKTTKKRWKFTHGETLAALYLQRYTSIYYSNNHTDQPVFADLNDGSVSV